MRSFLIWVLLLLGIGSVEAKVVLPNLLSDNAVLQRNDTVLLWGSATPHHKVVVIPSWSGRKYTTKANAKGEWRLSVVTVDAGEGYSITFDDGELTSIENILLGEVWLCSGQSNMEMPMNGFVRQPVEGAANEIAKAKSSTPIRYFKVDRKASNEPLDATDGCWAENRPDVVAGFSAAAYFFADYLQEVLDVPVGVIATSWGGTIIETWMSPDMLLKVDDYDLSHLDSAKVAANAHMLPCCLYNAMIHPLLNYKFKGVIWYQGETNRFNPYEYRELFPKFVDGLREKFDCGNFPFYYAQIAPFRYTGDKRTALLRSVMSEFMYTVDNCGMISLLDAGENSSIHPRNKRVVGERFAYWALGDAYGIDGIKYKVPQYKDMKVVKADARFPCRIAIKFIDAEGGICFKEDAISDLFEVAGVDKKFYPAKVRNMGEAEYQLEVWSDDVAEPIAVRYAFNDYVKGDVFNDMGLPVPSFRSDDWEIE